ncbi:MAG: Rpn family recombination-promoting nuclease/putative transposase [Prosthecobacter sp.]|nr:Rpn family recombination-promoting nuclease/putative transposase [Prosthecobacter sp.]
MSDFDLAAQSNDGYFKAVFSQPEQAAAFFQGHLPAPVAAHIDWSSLTPVPTTFVKRSLQQAHSDLIFSAKAGGREVLLYLLFEHQTTVDPAMPLRLLNYVLEILNAHEKEHGLPLPAVLPFVLHQGPQTWTVSTRFEDLLELPEDLAADLLPYLPKFTHALLDLTQFDPAKDEHHAQMQVVLQLMKLAREKRINEFFAWWAPHFVVGLFPEEFLGLLLTYALHGDSSLDVEQIYHTLESNSQLKEKTMSVAEQLIAKGKAEGKAEGMAKGKAEGKAEGQARGVWLGKLQVLQELMALPVTSSEEVTTLEIEELKQRYQGLQLQYEAQFKDR